jgi:hypothetical protein
MLVRYSWAGIWVSLSRHALSFKRRHTQHRPSFELGAHSLAQTVHRRGFLKRSDSIDSLACSRRTSGTIGSARGVADGG